MEKETIKKEESAGLELEGMRILVRTIFEETYQARMDMKRREKVYGEWSREYDLALARLRGLYTVIEISGMEELYQNWKRGKINEDVL